MSNGGAMPPKEGTYSPPRGPKNMGEHPDVYRDGLQGPAHCDNDESGTPGDLNSDTHGNGGTQHG